MRIKNINKNIESKDKIVEVTFKLVTTFSTGTVEQYKEALLNYYSVLNKELGIR